MGRESWSEGGRVGMKRVGSKGLHKVCKGEKVLQEKKQ